MPLFPTDTPALISWRLISLWVSGGRYRCLQFSRVEESVKKEWGRFFDRDVILEWKERRLEAEQSSWGQLRLDDRASHF